MKDYLFYDNLVVKITDPAPNFRVSGSRDMLNPLYGRRMPALFVFVETEQFDHFEPIFNEIAADYIHDEKIFAYLIDGQKSNFLNEFDKLPEALIVYHQGGFFSELFSRYSRGAEMTKERLKTWFEAQMSFIIRRYGSVIYTEECINRIYYAAVKNDEGDIKIWPLYRDIPTGWEDCSYAIGGGHDYKEVVIKAVEKFTMEYDDYKAEDWAEASAEERQKAWEKARDRARKKHKIRCPEAYNGDTPISTNYIVISSNFGDCDCKIDYKIWLTGPDIPSGWDDTNEYSGESRQEAIETAKRCTADYLLYFYYREELEKAVSEEDRDKVRKNIRKTEKELSRKEFMVGYNFE